MVFRAAIVVITCAIAIAASKLHPLSDEFINHINSKQTSWKAGRNFPPNTPINHLKGKLGVDPKFNVNSLKRVKHEAKLTEDLPENFDPREKWPNCPSIREIRDQGSCSSSWAFAAVETITDRVCIASNGTKQFYVSAEDLLSCCSNNKGCHNGNPTRGWSHWQVNGVVSGGNFNSSQGCRPYSFPPCKHLVPNSESYTGDKQACVDHKDVETPKCIRACAKNYPISYDSDKLYGKRYYTVELEIHIKPELFHHGPVEAVFWLYADFFNYKSGVYTYSGGDFVALHAVKLMGWGVENGTKYWLAANSWGTDWGDNGFFKILRGEDHLRIASNIITGEPRLD